MSYRILVSAPFPLGLIGFRTYWDLVGVGPRAGGFGHKGSVTGLDNYKISNNK